MCLLARDTGNTGNLSEDKVLLIGIFVRIRFPFIDDCPDIVTGGTTGLASCLSTCSYPVSFEGDLQSSASKFSRRRQRYPC